VVDREDEESLYAAIVSLCENNALSREDCRKRAARFDANRRFEEYVALYRRNIS
jgi:hypothetical protein